MENRERKIQKITHSRTHRLFGGNKFTIYTWRTAFCKRDFSNRNTIMVQTHFSYVCIAFDTINTFCMHICTEKFNAIDHNLKTWDCIIEIHVLNGWTRAHDTRKAKDSKLLRIHWASFTVIITTHYLSVNQSWIKKPFLNDIRTLIVR